MLVRAAAYPPGCFKPKGGRAHGGVRWVLTARSDSTHYAAVVFRPVVVMVLVTVQLEPDSHSGLGQFGLQSTTPGTFPCLDTRALKIFFTQAASHSVHCSSGCTTSLDLRGVKPLQEVIMGGAVALQQEQHFPERVAAEAVLTAWHGLSTHRPPGPNQPSLAAFQSESWW